MTISENSDKRNSSKKAEAPAGRPGDTGWLIGIHQDSNLSSAADP